MLLYIVRHGDPDYATDSLTEKGKAQAKALVPRLVRAGICEIYSSPLGRAKATAAPTAAALGLPVQIEPWLSEDLAWRTMSANQEVHDWAFRDRNRLIGKNECYETRDSFHSGFYKDDARAEEEGKLIAAGSDALLARLGYVRTGEGNGYLAKEPNEKKVAVFCHQGISLHWISHLLNLPYHVITPSFDITHTGVTVFSFGGSGKVYPVCLMLSDMSHLQEAGLPYLYQGCMEI